MNHLLGIQFKIVRKISMQIQQGNPGIKDILRVAISELRNVIGCDRIIILRTPQAKEYCTVIAESAKPNYSLLGNRYTDLCIKELPKNKTVTINQNTENIEPECLKQLMRDINVRTSLSVCLKIEEKIWGFLICHHETIFTWSDQKTELITNICDFILISIKQLEVLEINRKKEKYISLMAEIVFSLIDNKDFDNSIRGALEKLSKATNAKSCFLFKDFECIEQWEGQNRDISCLSEQLRTFLFPLLSNNSTIVGDVNKFSPKMREWLISNQIEKIAFIPILVDGSYWGFIEIDNFGCTWGEAENSILKKIAFSIGNIINQRHIQESLKMSLKEIIDNIPIIIYRIDTNGFVISCEGKELENISFFREGSNVFDDSEETPEIHSLFKKAFALPKTSSIIELSECFFNNHTVLLSSKELAGIAVNVTGQSLAQRDLENIIYAISHDLKEPLRAIANNFTLLERRLTAINIVDTEVQSRLDTGRRSVKKVLQLIDDQLELSRINHRGKPFVLCEAKQIVQETLDILSELIEETKTKVEIITPLPSIKCDPTQIGMLFQNLISNAIKFHRKEQGTPLVWISCQAVSNSRYWQFSVADNGIGIEERYQKQIFEIWKRLHDEKEFPGTGMGLAICAKIVKRHRGKIWVVSEGKNNGSAFYFTLPISESNLFYSEI